MKKIEPNIPKLKQIFSHCAEKGIDQVNIGGGIRWFSYGLYDGMPDVKPASTGELQDSCESKDRDRRIGHTMETADPYYPQVLRALKVNDRSDRVYVIEIEIEDLVILIQKGLWTRTDHQEEGIESHPINVRQALELL